MWTEHQHQYTEAKERSSDGKEQGKKKACFLHYSPENNMNGGKKDRLASQQLKVCPEGGAREKSTDLPKIKKCLFILCAVVILGHFRLSCASSLLAASM